MFTSHDYKQFPYLLLFFIKREFKIIFVTIISVAAIVKKKLEIDRCKYDNT